MAATGEVFAALTSCLMPDAFSGGRDFEDFWQHFTTAARFSGWQAASKDNRFYYFALRLKSNAFFYSTITVAQQQGFDQLVAAFCKTYTTKVEVLKAKLEIAKQQTNQTNSAFLHVV